MRIAVLGATSQIAKDLLRLVLPLGRFELSLFARDPEKLNDWLRSTALPAPRKVGTYAEFGLVDYFDAILNFVGSGDPVRTARMGREILDVTRDFDELALGYLRGRPHTKYLFMSSAAALGHVFSSENDDRRFARFPLDAIDSIDFYGFSKLAAEMNHRSLRDFDITDIRIYSYASEFMSLEGAFLISVIGKSIVDGTVLQTDDRDIARDYIGSEDLLRLISACMERRASNRAVDCYSAAPTTKMAILKMAAEKHGLAYDIHPASGPAGSDFKAAYYPRDRRGPEFGYAPLHTSSEVVERALDGMVRAHRAKAPRSSSTHHDGAGMAR